MSGAGTGGVGGILTGTYNYQVVCYDAYGNESPALTTTVNVASDSLNVTLSDIPTDPSIGG